MMAQLVVRKLDDEVKERLRKRAELRGVSLEEEVRCILTTAVRPPDEPGLGTQIAALFAEFGLQEGELQLPNWSWSGRNAPDFSGPEFDHLDDAE